MSLDRSQEEAFAPVGPQTGANDYRGALIMPVDPAGRLLMQLRDHNPAAVHPGQWGLFGGEAEPGETLAEAAAREFEEETGIARAPGDFAPFATVVSPVSRRRLFGFILAFDLTAADIRLREGAGFGFIEARDFPKMDIVPATRLLLAAWVRGRT